MASYEIFVRVSQEYGEMLEALQKALSTPVTVPSKKDVIQFALEELYKKYDGQTKSSE